MSVQELEQQVQALEIDDLARFVQWFEAYRRQVLGELADLDDPHHDLTREQRTELLRRVEFAKDHPESLEPWEGTTDQIRQHLHALHAQKAARGGD
jgi:hypothetical protein